MPIQRNTRAEYETIKEGETPEKWQEDEATAKLGQKDVDARWTKKGAKSIYAGVDVKHKLIQGYVTTPASDGDITVMEELTDPRRGRKTSRSLCGFGLSFRRSREVAAQAQNQTRDAVQAPEEQGTDVVPKD